MHILVVEDQKKVAEALQEGLTLAGFKVTVCSEGEEGFFTLSSQDIDLLILDLLMPEKDGFEVLEYIHEKGYTFPVIVLTNLSLDIDKEKCKELGAVDFLLKSEMTTEGLGKKIHEYL